MWLCTQYGFFSVVQKLPGEFHVRARMRRDLENLLDVCGAKWKIHRSAPPADYRYRIVLDADDVALVFSCISQGIDYSNFKGRIHALPDQRAKGNAYLGLWSDLQQLQD